MPKRLRTLFAGTTEFAAVCLRFLIETGRTPELVLTQPDRPKGRGRRLQMPAVKELALASGIKVLQPEKLKKNSALQEELQKLAPDLAIVVAYGRFLPSWLVDLPKLGCVNVHASLLPAYRGAAPIHWSIINGEKEAGLTLMEVSEEMDAGNIIFQERVNIAADETFGTLNAKLMACGPSLLESCFTVLEAGRKLPSTPQNSTAATFAPALGPEHCDIDWQKSMNEVVQLIRGLSPKPTAFTRWQTKKLKIVGAEPVDSGVVSSGSKPGTIVMVEKVRLVVQCGKGEIALTEVIPESRKPMAIDAFINGFKPEVGQLMTHGDEHF